MKCYRNYELDRSFTTTEISVENDTVAKTRSGHGRDQLTNGHVKAAGVGSAAVDAVLHGRRNHTPR